MITRIREVRRAHGLTLAELASRCEPPTTAQTIGRLETGTRTVSLIWLERIARAMGVSSADLVALPDQSDLPVVAHLLADGARAPRAPERVLPPAPLPESVAIRVIASLGDYRAGDVLWCQRVMPSHFGASLNRDVLVPRPVGRFAFGRLIGSEDERLLVLPPEAGNRQQVIARPAWLAEVRLLVRAL